MANTIRFPDYFDPQCFTRESSEGLQAKVDALLRAMTPEETMNLCHGGTNPAALGQIANAGYLPGVPRLGVPEIRMYDGPAGVTSIYETTGLPVQEALAASWNPGLAYAYGKVAGSENFAVSGNTQLGSQYDVVRTPQFTRNPDMLGEDPFLTAQLAVEETRGIQEQHASATLKHFAAASIGSDMQNAADQQIDEQTLHQLYFPAFEAAIRRGGAASVMCSYNKTNGAYASANEYFQKTVLRTLWDFKGYMMSDWGANHALTTGKGMDVEMPSGTYNSSERLLLGIEKGRITWQDVQTAAGHVLYGLGMLGYLGLVQPDKQGGATEEPGRTRPIAMRDRYQAFVAAGGLEENAEICRRVAEQGSVLLKNRGALPLKPGDRVALLGLGAMQLLSGAGQERSYGRISRMKAPYAELKRLAPELDVTGCVGLDIFGVPVPETCLWQDSACTRPGVRRTWGIGAENTPVSQLAFNMGGQGKELKGPAAADPDEDADVPAFMPGWNAGFAADVPGHETGSPAGEDAKIEFTCGTVDGQVNQTYRNAADGTAFPYGQAFTFDCYLTVPEDGRYTLILQAIGGNTTLKIALDGEHYVSIGGTELREGAQWPWGSLVCTPEGMEVHGGTAELKAGVAYPVRLCANATERNKDMQLRFAWITPRQARADYTAALAAAQKAERVVFFLSGNYAPAPIDGPAVGGGFSMVRLDSLEPPEAQLRLLRDVKAAMPPEARLTVVTNYGQVFALGEAEPLADAILNVWTPGQEGGAAVAGLLLGRVNPSGKTAVSMPARDCDTLVTDTERHRQTRYAGYANAQGRQVVDYDEGIFTGYRWYDKTGIEPLYPFGHGLSYTSFRYSDLTVQAVEDGAEAVFTVENTGGVTGTEIAQVYLGACPVPEHIQMAERQLCGFARLEELQPGEKRTVTVRIPRRSFQYWDPQQPLTQRPDGTRDKWVTSATPRTVFVGSSSRNLPLSAVLS